MRRRVSCPEPPLTGPTRGLGRRGLQQPEAPRELVGGQAGETQALMGPRVVLLVEAAQEGGEIGGTTPRLRGQPLLEGTHEPLGDAVRLRTMAGDEHMDELRLIGEAGQGLRREVAPPIRNQEVQFGLYSAFESGPTAAGESGPIPGRRRRSPHESLW